MDKLQKRLNAEYRAMHGIYWMVYCVAVSFAVVFMHARGYSNSEIGVVMAAGNIGALVIQPLVAALADKYEKVTLTGVLVGLCAFTALALAVLILVPRRSGALMVSYAVFLACEFAKQPFCNSYCGFLERSGAYVNFGVARGIGSFCYAVLSVILGFAVERAGVGILPWTALAITGLFFMLLASLSRQTRSFGSAHTARASEGKKGLAAFLFGNKRFLLFLFATALLYFPHSMFNNFIINFVEMVGGDSADMGAICSVMALLELPAMFMFDRLLRVFRCSSMLKFAAVMFTVKEIIIALATSLPLLYAANIFQGLSFAVFIPATVRYVQEVISPADFVKGQACVTSMITLGSIFSSAVGGMLLDRIGPHPTLVVGAAASLVGTLLMLPSIVKTKKLGE